MKPLDFNPDELVLEKKDVTDFANIVLKYWGRTLKDKAKNIKLIAGLEMLKMGVEFTSEADFKVIWSMLLFFINELQYQNAMQAMLKEGGKHNFALVVSQLKTDLKDGGIEKMFAKLKQ